MHKNLRAVSDKIPPPKVGRENLFNHHLLNGGLSDFAKICFFDALWISGNEKVIEIHFRLNPRRRNI